MKPKSIITVTAQSLPMILKYQGKEYIVKLTANGSLHMIKDNIQDTNDFEIDPNPATVDLSPSGMAQAKKDGDKTMEY